MNISVQDIAGPPGTVPETAMVGWALWVFGLVVVLWDTMDPHMERNPGPGIKFWGPTSRCLGLGTWLLSPFVIALSIRVGASGPPETFALFDFVVLYGVWVVGMICCARFTPECLWEKLERPRTQKWKDPTSRESLMVNWMALSINFVMWYVSLNPIFHVVGFLVSRGFFTIIAKWKEPCCSIKDL